MLTFRPDQVRRYSRHILLPDVGGLGQARLLAATVDVDVASAAGRIAAAYLAASGVSLVLHGPAAPITDARFPLTRADLGRPLLATLAARLAALNPDVRVSAAPTLSEGRTGDSAPSEHRTGGTPSSESRTGDSRPSEGRTEHLPPMSENRTGGIRLTLEDRGEDLAEAMARGGEAAARIVHALAVRP